MVVDFTKNRPEECMAAMKVPDEKHLVQVQDIRGRETQFTLNQNGFQYVSHDVPGLDKARRPDTCRTVLIPETEKLVQQM
jgi:hypothetical protein